MDGDAEAAEERKELFLVLARNETVNALIAGRKDIAFRFGVIIAFFYLLRREVGQSKLKFG